MTERTGGVLGAALVLVVALAGVAATQPRLARLAHAAKETDDVFALPPPEQLHAAVLGWDAAAVDLLWADLLVAYGTHWSERRDFRDIPRYVDTILELEPNYPPIYRFVDTLLAYRPLQGTEADARQAKAYLQRGTRERADDANVWLKYGQFLAFIGPSFLKDSEEDQRAAWRKEGAEAIGHAVELGADPDRALSAASMLTRSGATREAIHYLEHAYAFTEHPAMREVHEAIGRKLATLEQSTAVEAANDAAKTIADRWQRELPVVARDLYVILGPVANPLRCAGLAGARDPACARSWAAVTGITAERGSSEDSP